MGIYYFKYETISKPQIVENSILYDIDYVEEHMKGSLPKSLKIIFFNKFYQFSNCIHCLLQYQIAREKFEGCSAMGLSID